MYSNNLYYMFKAAKKRDNYKIDYLMKTIKNLTFYSNPYIKC